jgi:hypothetical protein
MKTKTPTQAISPSQFLEFFGDYPYIRVLDFLIENDIFDYNKKDICKYANVSWNTMNTFWNQLEETNIVKHTRKVGKAEMYQLNTQNPIVQQLVQLNKRLLKLSFEKIGKPTKRVSVAADSD